MTEKSGWSVALISVNVGVATASTVDYCNFPTIDANCFYITIWYKLMRSSTDAKALIDTVGVLRERCRAHVSMQHNGKTYAK